MKTHEVHNQVPPLIDYDLFETDPVLPAAVEREGARWALGLLGDFGRNVGTADNFEAGRLANENEPVLRTHDRVGNRIDEVEFHPAYHRFMDLSISNGLHSLPYERPSGEGGRVARDAAFSIVNQVEAGHSCPISMTTAVVPALRAEPGLAAKWEPKIISRDYDAPLGALGSKAGVTMGMGMTEGQGGSDVRTNTSVATPIGDDAYELVGHKWFVSAPMSDGFLVTAVAPGGLTCFLLPRVLDDGTRNPIVIQRLKDKVGNKSNASSEMELEGAVAYRVGEEGRGVRTIIEMVTNTRMDCVVGTIGLMRQAVAQAAWHTLHREAFGANLIEKGLMQNVLADLEIEVEVATLMMMRLSGAFDRASLDPAEEAFRRLATPVVKYWVTKRCTDVVREAMECLGGNGYVEESIMPRLFRESPVNAIWEGSGNVIALDTLRAMATAPASIEAFVNDLDGARGGDVRVDRAIDEVGSAVGEIAGGETGARRLVEKMATTLGAALAVRFADPAVADAFVSSRVEGDHGHMYGTLNHTLPLDRIARRSIPAV
ncbi:MAG: DNA alkylation response protein [Actinomycetia bacterium]|nr:DNA alkylation response protein [Actinomycetes bacterium]